MSKIFTYTVQVTAPDESGDTSEAIAAELNAALRDSAGWPRWVREYGWDVTLRAQGGGATVGPKVTMTELSEGQQAAEIPPAYPSEGQQAAEIPPAYPSEGQQAAGGALHDSHAVDDSYVGQLTEIFGS